MTTTTTTASAIGSLPEDIMSQQLQHHLTSSEGAQQKDSDEPLHSPDPETIRKRYESMSFDEMQQQMAESYRQLSEVLGNRVSTPSAASSSSSSSSSSSDNNTTADTIYNVPDSDDEYTVMERTDLDDATKRTKMNKVFSRAASGGDVAKVTQLLKDERFSPYIDIDAKDEDGATPLIYAACFGKVEIAQMLLEAGAKTDIQDSSGWSALMWATTNNHNNLVKVLLEHGASSHTRSAKGRTVYDFVNTENQKIVEILATNPRDSMSSTSSVFGRVTAAASSSMSSASSNAGDLDFYYQSTVEGYDTFMAEEAERRQELLKTAMALVGNDSDLGSSDDEQDDDNDSNTDYDNGQDDDLDDDMENEFYWDKCLPDQMFVFSGDNLSHILDTMITHVKLPMETRQEICVPANVVFLSARFAHYFSSSELLQEVLEGALSRMSKVTKENANNVHALSFWMSNLAQLLYYLKKDTGLVVATAEYQLRLSEMISETYTMLILDTERRILKVLGPAMLESEQIPGMEDVDFVDDWQRFFRRSASRRSVILSQESVQMRRHTSTPAHGGIVSPQSVTSLLSTTFYVLQTYEVHPTIIIQALAQLFHFMSCELFNRILTNKKLLSRSKALQIRMNLSYVEDWIRHNHLPSSLLSYLSPSVQLLQLLQCLSQLTDFESFVHTVKKFDTLNNLQIKRCIVNYRYEVNEKRLPDEIKEYVIQLADDTVRYRQKRSSLRRSRTCYSSRPLSRVNSMQRSLSRPESMSSLVGSLISSVGISSSNSLPPSMPSTPTTEELPVAIPAAAAAKPAAAIESDTDEDDDDNDEIREIRDTKFMLPFSVPSTTRMVSTNGWAPDNSKERLSVPVIPEKWMEKLDTDNYAPM
ncbi:hypothetical protein BDB00DRAFT_787255 [Zychaea mexicana]|uniref:uncharacterized protein n=1 Tax=Zychaea mexicana TaxID=64656 RepID=UPI0022FF0554|nr:uncharacterized protein BDB00DRAFT_787255 [Zychaea mexicana]KAI9494425.1 hypothetical protein BDB00DRAFT_787255 [Zychaea mexicana]